MMVYASPTFRLQYRGVQVQGISGGDFSIRLILNNIQWVSKYLTPKFQIHLNIIQKSAVWFSNSPPSQVTCLKSSLYGFMYFPFLSKIQNLGHSDIFNQSNTKLVQYLNTICISVVFFVASFFILTWKRDKSIQLISPIICIGLVFARIELKKLFAFLNFFLFL